MAFLGMAMRYRANKNRRRPVKSKVSIDGSEVDQDEDDTMKSKSLCVDVYPNPSPFAMYVHLHELEITQGLKELFETLNKSSQLWDVSMDESDDKKASLSKQPKMKTGRSKDDKNVKDKHPQHQEDENIKLQTLPKMVLLGITGVIEIVCATRHSNPDICQKVLDAFYKIVAHNELGVLKNEPSEALDPLFEMLLDIVINTIPPTSNNTTPPTSNNTIPPTSNNTIPPTSNNNSTIVSTATSCLIALILSVSKTDRILQAICTLLLSKGATATLMLPVPEILRTFQRSIESALCGRVISKNIFKDFLSTSSRVESWPVPLEPPGVINHHSVMTATGSHLFLRVGEYLAKIGTGYGNTVKGHLYKATQGLTSSDAPSWLGIVRDRLLLYVVDSAVLLEISQELLEVMGEHKLPPELSDGAHMFSNGDILGAISMKDEYELVIYTLTLTEGEQTELLIDSTQSTTLIRTVLLASGSDEFLNVKSTTEGATVIYSRKNEIPQQISLSSKCVQFISHTGHVYYSGSGEAYGSHTQTAVNEWIRIALLDDSECIQMSLSGDGTYAAFIDSSRKLYTSGIAIKGISAHSGGKHDGKKQPIEYPALSGTPLPSLLSCQCGRSSPPILALLTTDKTLLVYGDQLTDGLKLKESGLITLPADARRKVESVSIGNKHILILTDVGHVYAMGDNTCGQCGCTEVPEEDEGVEQKENKLLVSKPTLIELPDNVISMSCGASHSAVLTETLEVYVWGSNDKGQLGTGDNEMKKLPQKLKLPRECMQVHCGEEYTLFLLGSGELYGCGDNSNGVFGLPADTITLNEPTLLSLLSFSKADSEIKQICAASNNILILEQQKILSTSLLRHCKVLCNKNTVAFIPTGEKAKSSQISAINLSLKSLEFTVQDYGQYDDCSTACLALERTYGNTWMYDSSVHQITQYNKLIASFKSNEESQNFGRDPLQISQTIFSSALSLPNLHSVSRIHAGLNLLSCMYCLLLKDKCQVIKEEEDTPPESKTKMVQHSSQDPTMGYTVANRYEGEADIWYHDGSADAIMFKVDRQIMLGGVGIFSGNGDLSGNFQLYDSHEKSQGPTITSIDAIEIPKEIGGDIYPCMLDSPQLLEPFHWYTANLKLEGAQAIHSGKSGKTEITEDGVTFTFKYSDLSHNGTDINSGQLPCFYFSFPKVSKLSLSDSLKDADLEPPVKILNSSFYLTVTPSCFESLLSLIEWLCSSIRSSLMELSHEESGTNFEKAIFITDIERLLYALEACLKHCDIYFHQLYQKSPLTSQFGQEKEGYIDYVLRFRHLLRDILWQPLPKDLFDPQSPEGQLKERLVKLCQDTFISCFAIFYPTAKVRHVLLCELLNSISAVDLLGGAPGDTMLVSVLEAITDTCTVGLSHILQHSQFAMRYAPVKTKFAHLESFIESATLDTLAETSLLSYQAILTKLQAYAYTPLLSAVKEAAHITDRTRAISQASANLILAKLHELSMFIQAIQNTPSEVQKSEMKETAKRFASVKKNWPVVKQDAIAFEVNRRDIWIYGVGVYAGKKLTVEITLYIEKEGDILEKLQFVKANIAEKDSNKATQIATVLFNNPVCISKGNKYHISCTFVHTKKIASVGNQGVKDVECGKGLKFTFYKSKLSENGTNVSQGQIPSLLYSHNGPPFGQNLISNDTELPLKDCSEAFLHISQSLFDASSEIFDAILSGSITPEIINTIGNSSFFNTLLHETIALLLPISKLFPQNTVEIMYTVKQLLTEITTLNRSITPQSNYPIDKLMYISFESEHPYSISKIIPYNVNFPSEVKWLLVNFSPQCCTYQLEDSLKVYIPSQADSTSTDILVLGPFSTNKNWPKISKILKGNKATFVFESASNYLKEEDEAKSYGFKCDVIGYPWDPLASDTLLHLERLLHYVAGSCASFLLQSKTEIELVCPLKAVDENTSSDLADMDTVFQIANCEFTHYEQLLEGGLRVDCDSIEQALKGHVSQISEQSCLPFLHNFIENNYKTSGGRLSQYLQTESTLDYSKSKIHLPIYGIKSGWPSLLSVALSDSRGNEMFVKDLKLTLVITEIPSDAQLQAKDPIIEMYSQLGLKSPDLTVPYKPVVTTHGIYVSICCNEAYVNYSLEELRFAALHSKELNNTSESIHVIALHDKKYIAKWLPRKPGNYNISLMIEDKLTETCLELTVTEPNHQETAPIYPMITFTKHAMKVIHSESDIKSIKLHSKPDLDSSVIGTVPKSKLIYYYEDQKISNNDGQWLRVRPESIKAYSKQSPLPSRAYCLVFIASKKIHAMREEIKEATISALQAADSGVRQGKQLGLKRSAGPGSYEIVECGESGHVLRDSPTHSGTALGFIIKGSVVQVLEEKANNTEVWMKLKENELVKTSLTTEGIDDIWLLGANFIQQIIYLRKEGDENQEQTTSSELNGSVIDFEGFGFKSPTKPPYLFNFARISSEKKSLVYKFEGEETEERNTQIYEIFNTKPPSEVQIGLSPELARSQRAIYAAYLWQEGLVFDAMASATFIKFYSATPRVRSRSMTEQIPKKKAKREEDIPKSKPNILLEKLETSKSETEGSIGESGSFANLLPESTTQSQFEGKEEDVKNDIDVINKDAVLPDKDETKEIFIENQDTERVRSDTPLIDDFDDKLEEEQPKEKIPVTLRYLINFWDTLIESVQPTLSTACKTQPIPEKILDKFKKDDKESKEKTKQKSNQNSHQVSCELCGGYYNYPITFHMRSEHPGCDGPGDGWGFNSTGKYCAGWAGNCGDGGMEFRQALWYILCQNCYSNYFEKNQKIVRRFKPLMSVTKNKPHGQLRKLLEKPILNVLEENAFFLLDLETAHPQNYASSITSQKPPFLRHVSEPRVKTKPQFLRSETVGTTTRDVKESENDEYTNVDLNVQLAESGIPLLTRPSPTLAKLMANYHSSKKEEVGRMPIFLQFITTRHDNEGLRSSLTNKMCVSRLRVFALEYIKWLLEITTDSACIHDTLWHFCNSFYEIPSTTTTSEDVTSSNRHPSNLLFGSSAVKLLQYSLYELLSYIADLLSTLQIGSSAQEMAIKSWCIPFNIRDHGFIHSSNIFSRISHVLSLLEDASKQRADKLDYTMQEHNLTKGEDVTSQFIITVSSREAMLGSLTDNSTETFWESGDEFKTRARLIYLEVPKKQKLSEILICVYIDNVRDNGFKCENYSILVGNTKDKKDIVTIQSIILKADFVGWLKVAISQEKIKKLIHISLKGSNNSCRVRQIKVLHRSPCDLNTSIAKNPHTMQLNSCENQTIHLFRALTSQVFGSILQNTPEQIKDKSEMADKEKNKEEIREQIVGILEENKLSKFQIEMCNQIIKNISNELKAMKESMIDTLSAVNWTEVQNIDQLCSLQEKSVRDAISYELLTMLMALAQSELVAKHLSKNSTLIKISFELLHASSSRCQLKVLQLLDKLLKHVTAEDLASTLSVEYLPTSSSLAILVQRPLGTPGLLDYLLTALAKSLEIQIKTRGGEDKAAKHISLYNLTTKEEIMKLEGDAWFWSGAISKETSLGIIQLIKSMYNGDLGEHCKSIAKTSVAQSILMITKVKENERTVKDCRAMKCFWLLMGSLCVLDDDLCEQLSSNTSDTIDVDRKALKLCVNHDDGKTTAVVECDTCGTLCFNCNHYLHLSKKMRDHKCIVFKEEEETMQVKLSEGCGRTKLNWLMAMVDTNSFKGMSEFRGQLAQAQPGSGLCRFCDTQGASEMIGLGFVCDDNDCQEKAKKACRTVHECGHICGGVKDEKDHLPCLHGCSAESNIRQDAEDMCMICYTESLSAAPSVRLKCGHVFHYNCSVKSLESKWNGPRITFRFLFCSICQISPLEAPQLETVFRPMMTIYEKVKSKALLRLDYENKMKSEALTDVKSKFYGKPAEYAIDRYAYYLCFKCTEPYYGGEARCIDVVNTSDEYDSSELVCGGCSNVTQAQICPKHGTDYLEFKCRYCCSIATFFCFGTTHFCQQCHYNVGRVCGIPKDELPSCPVGPKAMPIDGTECPLKVKHPPTGEEYALGCGVCRNAQTF